MFGCHNSEVAFLKTSVGLKIRAPQGYWDTILFLEKGELEVLGPLLGTSGCFVTPPR